MDESQPLLYSLDERIEARVQAIRQERDWWPCQRRCDYCCRHLAQPPELSAAEWTRVDEAVAQLPSPERLQVEQRIHSLLQQMAMALATTPVVCPYLNEQEGVCRIYDARPIACRTYGFFVTRDHDQYCQKVEAEVNDHSDTAIIWGNGDAIRKDMEQVRDLQIINVPIPQICKGEWPFAPTAPLGYYFNALPLVV